jgi:GT2 family glycosyltransferase
MPHLSIIIINYNTFSLTCKCIESLLRYTKGIDYEIILVDNASSECSADRFLELFPQIKLIKSPENVGFAKGNNLGLQHAQGVYILLLNSDIELTENSIEVCLNKIKQGEKIGVVSPKLVYPDGQIQHVAGRFPSISYEFIELCRLHKIFGSKSLLGFYFNHQTEMYVDWVWGAFFLTKKVIIEQLPNGKMPDDFFMYFEDVQWCYQIKKLGYKILYTPETQVVHHVSGSSKNTNTEINSHKIQQSLVNERTFFLKEKGWLYTKTLYFLRTLKYLSLRKKNFRTIAKIYWKEFCNFS